jgi:AraC family transcriptional activator of pobA
MPDILHMQTLSQKLDPPVPGGAEKGTFNIFQVEELLPLRNKPAGYSRRDFFKVSLVTGHSKIHYADRSVEVDGSVLVFTNPLIPFFWETISPQQSGFVCVFTEAFFSRFTAIKDFPVFQVADQGIIALPEPEARFFAELFARMYAELQGDYVYKYDLLRNQLMEVVHGALKLAPLKGHAPQGNAAERIAALFKELLERQFPIELSSQVIKLSTPSQFAAQLHIHINHLNKALKTITGHTTIELINNRVLEEARILLKSTGWTINEIAWSLGFAEPNHFSSFFKRALKLTPNQYRQSAD